MIVCATPVTDAAEAATLAAGLPRMIDRVAEPLRKAIHGLARTVEVEAQPPFVDRALRRTSRAIQLLAQPVEQSHTPLPPAKIR